MEVYLAYTILLALWLFGVTPAIGCIFEMCSVDSIYYIDYLVVGIKAQIVIIAICTLIGAVVWSLLVVTHHLL